MSQHEGTDDLSRPGSGPAGAPWSSRHRGGSRSLPTTLLVGDPSAIGALHGELLRNPLRDYRVIGCCLPTRGRVGETFQGLPVLGGTDDVVDVVRRYDVDTVAVLPPSGWDEAALARLEVELEAAGADLLLGPASGPSAAPPTPGHRTPGRRRPALHGMRALVKAAFDRTLAALVLVLLAPLLLGVALGVKVTSRGPVLVRCECLGRDGRPFRLLRFRTTVGDPAGASDPSAPGETTLGSLLRRSSVDELPQLLNVLTGDMSLVGPRPGLPAARPGAPLLVKPGLIGLAAIGSARGRSEDERLRTDVDYARNWSLLLDLVILGRSFSAALRGGGGR